MLNYYVFFCTFVNYVTYHMSLFIEIVLRYNIYCYFWILFIVVQVKYGTSLLSAFLHLNTAKALDFQVQKYTTSLFKHITALIIEYF